MPTIDEYYSSSSGGTLKASDIEGDELDAVVESWRTHKFDGDENTTVFLKLEGQEKEFRVNYTNAQRISEMYGKDIEDWVGKKLTLMPDTITKGKYKGQETIIVRVRRTARNAPNPNPKPKYNEQNPPPPLDDEIGF